MLIFLTSIQENRIIVILRKYNFDAHEIEKVRDSFNTIGC